MDAYSPAEVEDKCEKIGVKKATMPFLPSFLLSVIAGGSIGLGAMYYTLIMADPTISFAAQRVLGGMVFTLGLALVVVAGAELFTGNNLIVCAFANRQLTAWQVLRNWIVVWVGNLVGAFGLAFVVLMSHHPEMNNGAVGAVMLKVAIGKITPDSATLFFKGVMCNLLVCLAVWLSYAGRGVTDKIFALFLPISAFVACGFEHSIANQYFLSMAWLLTVTGQVPAGLDVSVITLGGIFHNLIPVTLGNIVGGSGMVGIMYWLIYRKGMGTPGAAPSGSSVTKEPSATVR
jgi:formate/nitrite transporter